MSGQAIVTRGWSVWLEDDSGPLGWGWFGGKFDAERPDGACQIAVFRTRLAARYAVKQYGQRYETRMRVRPVIVTIAKRTT